MENNIASQQSQGICSINQCKQMVSVTQNLRMVVGGLFIPPKTKWSYKILKNAGQQKLGIQIPSRERSRIPLKGKRKIIGSKLPAGRGYSWYVTFQEGLLGDFQKFVHFHVTTIPYHTGHADFFKFSMMIPSQLQPSPPRQLRRIFLVLLVGGFSPTRLKDMHGRQIGFIFPK